RAWLEVSAGGGGGGLGGGLFSVAARGGPQHPVAGSQGGRGPPDRLVGQAVGRPGGGPGAGAAHLLPPLPVAFAVHANLLVGQRAEVGVAEGVVHYLHLAAFNERLELAIVRRPGV